MKKILLFTKDNDLAQELKPTFFVEGYSVDIINNFSLSFKEISDEVYDVIIVDIEFTFESELDLISFIKQNQSQAEIIILTDIENIDLALESIKKGAYLYLPKPFKKEHLLTIIEKALKNQKNFLHSKEYEKILI